MDLIPAIDLLGGDAVRLVQGDYARRAASVAHPDEVVRGWVRAGVRWLHLVDLDGAREGGPRNLAAASRLAGVARSEAADVRVELGGGLRTSADIESTLAAGLDVALLGTAAVEDASLIAASVQRWPGHVAVSVDVRGDRVAVDGWTRDADTDPIVVARSVAAEAVAHLVVTDVRRDGTRSGPNLELLARMRDALPAIRLVAAGGIGSPEQLEQLALAGIDGAIVGLALVDGTLTIGDALVAAGQARSEVA